jgi:phosphatidylserine/phosphatidylglycerophosphate/cardiolipin synthase-like enzyme
MPILANGAPESKRRKQSQVPADNEVTKVYCGEEDTTRIILNAFSNAKIKWDVCAGFRGPSIAMKVKEFRKAQEDLKQRGVNIRWITEIINDNIGYCKELMEFAEVRHLDGIRVNFATNETEYISTSNL